MANEKSDSHTARKNLPKLAGFIIGVALLIALAYIYRLNGYGETASPTLTPTSEPVVTFLPTNTQAIIPTNTPTAEEIEKLKQEEILGIMEAQESRWVEMGYLPDYTKNGEDLTVKTIEINGQEVEAVGFRIGMTEIWVAKDLVDRKLDYYGGAKKQVGEVVVPNEKVEDWQYKIAVLGAYIHAANMGFGEDVLGYLQSLQGNTDNNYVMQDFRVGADGLIHIGELPPVNPNVPVRMFIGNPTLTKAQAEEGKIYGGEPQAPYNLPYYITGGHAGVTIGNDGGMTIAFTNVLTSEGLLNVDYNENAARIINIMPKVGVLQSLRSPNSSYGGPGSSNPFIYIEKDILGSDYHTPLFIWKRK